MFFPTRKITNDPAKVRCITITTDFGSRDWYVGVMKGVIAWTASSTKTIDLTHEIPQGAIRNAAFQLWNSFSYFPEGTVHLAVVDPGVGSSRRVIAIKSRRYYWVGPDNGILSWAADQDGEVDAYEITNPKWTLPRKSATFHGRDIFAPVAAGLSAGWAIDEIGPRIDDYIRLDWPTAKIEENEIAGEILYLDIFGNAISNVSEKKWKAFLGSTPEHSINPNVSLSFEGKTIQGIQTGDCYSSVNEGSNIALIGSGGFLEFSTRNGSFAAKCDLREGMKFKLQQQSGQ